MADQSLDQQSSSAPAASQSASPADEAPAPTQESVESNVTRVSDGQIAEAEQAIDNDPTIGTGDENAPAADNYDDEDAWPYRKLQAELGDRDLNASGKRPDLIARLRASDTERAADTGGVPTATVDPAAVQNGGIGVNTARSQAHAEVLQGLSAQRRQQQLATVAQSAQRASGSDED